MTFCFRVFSLLRTEGREPQSSNFYLPYYLLVPSCTLKPFYVTSFLEPKGMFQPFICQRAHVPSCQSSISFSESSFPLTSGRKSRALGATISCMRDRCRLRSETGWAEFDYSLCYFNTGSLPELSFSDNWSRRTETLGMRLASPVLLTHKA